VIDPHIGRLAVALVECCAGGRWDDIRVLTDPDLVSEETSSRSVLVGAEAVIARWTGVAAAFPTIRAEIRAVSTADDIAAVQVVWRAARGRGAADQYGEDPDAGKAVVLPDVVMSTWRRGRCVAELHRVGILTVLSAAAPEVLRSST
jgi:hypothetical protein